MGSVRDGEGSEWFLWSCGELAVYKCVSKDDGLMSDLERVKSQIPSVYQSFINEPAFYMNMATCLWYMQASRWETFGLEVTQFIGIEEVSAWQAKDYHAWASDYYERDIDVSKLEKLFNNRFDERLAFALNPQIDKSALLAEAGQIGINP